MRFPLYAPGFEHDACGVGFIADIRGRASHAIVDDGLTALERLSHRAATGADPNTGDGAGVMIQIPDRFFREEMGQRGIALPPPFAYGVGLFFGSPDREARTLAKMVFAMVAKQCGVEVIAWREVPTNNRGIGVTALAAEPAMLHALVAAAGDAVDETTLQNRLWTTRKRFQTTIRSSGLDDRVYFHVPSLSTRTLTYKGMLTPGQVRTYYTDLADKRVESAMCMFHSRFSTNTFPSWELAHPYSMIAHNGEINTLRANVNWMHAREEMLAKADLDGELDKVMPIIREGLSDSAALDSVVELLVRGGRSLPHALMMLIPEAWESRDDIDPELAAFYAFHGCMVEPWDGPAAVMFSDGKQIGATLDRSGLRPSRYWITADERVVVASEVGVLDVPPENIVFKGRLTPGKMLLVDLEAGRIVDDAEIKRELASEKPYLAWTREQTRTLADLPPAEAPPDLEGDDLRFHQLSHGYTVEDEKYVLAPMAEKAQEDIGSMGHDAALAVMSPRPQLLYDYFHQSFAQVTNPPLDAIREQLVTSTSIAIGAEGNLLDPQASSCALVVLDSPFVRRAELATLAQMREGAVVSAKLDMVFPVRDGPAGLAPALQAMFVRAGDLVDQGVNALVLSDRGVAPHLAPIPSLLAVAGLHNYLVRKKKRTKCTLLVESGDAREVHHFALLVGYGAAAVCPYLALDSVADLARRGVVSHSPDVARRRYLDAVSKGVVKVMSKMGISTVSAYCGAQTFEAVGLGADVIDKYFTKTPSRLSGLTMKDIAAEALARHARAQGRENELPPSGQYQWRRDGEQHLFTPETVFKLQHGTRQKRYDVFKEYTRTVDSLSRSVTLRGLLDFKVGAQPPVPIDEVEPVSAIVKRFATGAMSYGSLSREAHETLAIAMNRLGGRSNSGEGGEDRERYTKDANGDSRRSAVHQVASARFGVTSEYLVECDELQIKMAQGAKPGEGGQLPGNKVYPWIAKVRHATPGVGLISPPPHHDIYSIEDLAQLIHDLRCANDRARISVKLVAEMGVGTVAAGVVKAKSDVVLISGHDGGTGASPLGSIKHAGVPWELGLAEAQQTLIANGLRDRVVVQVDGQLKTGRDVVVGALLGADEFGFATAPLVVMGCIYMRVCHLDTCPVGVATQNPDLRARFTGQAEHVVAFFEYIAQEVRELMAQLGFRTMDAMIGRSDLLAPTTTPSNAKVATLDLSAICAKPPQGVATRFVKRMPYDHSEHLDMRLLPLCQPALVDKRPTVVDSPITNVDRTVGTMLGADLTRRHGHEGLPDDTLTLRFKGSAGQSFGAFVPRGMTLTLEGDANDYVGKGLSGGRLSVRPDARARFRAEENILIGNVALYGATGGEAFFRGIAGERFAVRNSGANAVVEGVGQHGCEYMTGGRVVILGNVGRNFAAGMSGGVAYIASQHAKRVNTDMVRVGPLEDPQEIDEVRRLIELHARLTGSTVAQRVLANWATSIARTVRVVSPDYERVMATPLKRTA